MVPTPSSAFVSECCRLWIIPGVRGERLQLEAVGNQLCKDCRRQPGPVRDAETGTHSS